jgi:diguanylate cyclase (GGDEF)-like protein/PAS domain S-box-containing protein
MSTLRKIYILMAGVLVTLCVLSFFANTFILNAVLSNEWTFILAVSFLSIAYYFVFLQEERIILSDKNEEIQSKLIEYEKSLNEKDNQLRIEKERVKHFSMFVEESHDAIMVTDAAGNIEYVNKRFLESTDYTLQELYGKSSRMVQPKWVTPENEEKFVGILDNGRAWRCEVNFKRKNGETYWAFESVSLMKDKNGKITHYLSTHRDISQEHELNEKLSYQATHDALTGLYNRIEFEKRIEKFISSKTDDQEHAVCFIDLDQFKIVNDTCGHAAGDELLRQLSSIIVKKVRQNDILARLGGDEFGILFEHCSLENAYRVTSSLLEKIKNFQFSWEGRTFKLGASIGLVAIDETMNTMTDLLKAADSACYMAKDLGRNRIHIYHADDSDMVQRQGEMQWVTKINNALDENLYCLFAQVIAPVSDNVNQHYEILVRMLDENNNYIPPGAFLPAAERYNLISKIDRWVISNTFEYISKNSQFQKQINFVSINLSGQSLTEDDFLEYVVNGLKESTIDTSKICFEITETAAISNLNRAIDFMTTLKELGCKFALDDFGSGLSSFGYLKNLPVDYLKIDGMFVKDILHDAIDHAMVKSINEIGHVMGMKTIAEFVENDEIRTKLEELKVDYVQGYGIGKPLPMHELLDDDNFKLAGNY